MGQLRCSVCTPHRRKLSSLDLSFLLQHRHCELATRQGRRSSSAFISRSHFTFTSKLTDDSRSSKRTQPCHTTSINPNLPAFFLFCFCFVLFLFFVFCLFVALLRSRVGGNAAPSGPSLDLRRDHDLLLAHCSRFHLSDCASCSSLAPGSFHSLPRLGLLISYRSLHTSNKSQIFLAQGPTFPHHNDSIFDQALTTSSTLCAIHRPPSPIHSPPTTARRTPRWPLFSFASSSTIDTCASSQSLNLSQLLKLHYPLLQILLSPTVAKLTIPPLRLLAPLPALPRRHPYPILMM